MAEHRIDLQAPRRHLGGRAVATLALFIAIALAAGGVGVLLQGSALDDGGWYDGLDKPPFTPPSWVFAPVWNVLYVAIGTAGWLLSRSRDANRRPALALWGAQLVLNALWTGAFFGLRSPGLGLLVIALLVVAIALLIGLAARVDRRAALLLVPYLAWVTFATALNVGILVLN